MMMKIYYFFLGCLIGLVFSVSSFLFLDFLSKQPLVLSTFKVEADAKPSTNENTIRDYILNNPTIIQEALNKIEKQTKVDETAKLKRTIVIQKKLIENSAHNVILGNPNGTITLVEFFDYNCGYCKKALDEITQILKKDSDVKLILRDLPVLGKPSMEAAAVAIALKQQFSPEKYLEFHTRLMKMKGTIGLERARTLAQEMGANTSKLDEDIQSNEVQETIQETANVAHVLSISGTPSFILGDEVIVGAPTAQEFEEKFQKLR